MNCEIPQFIDRNEITRYLPHRGKMLLLSRVTRHDVLNHTISCEYDITKECVFYEPDHDGIPSWAGFELMAQGICALTGITRRSIGCEPLPGLILSVSEFKAETEWLARMEMSEICRDSEGSLYSYVCGLFTAGNSGKAAVTAKISVIETEDINNLKKQR